MIESTKDLELEIKGQKVSIPKEDHYFTEHGQPVIKHAPLKRIAKQFGVRVQRVVLEFAINTNHGLSVAHRAFGVDDDGFEISQIGEASAFNTDGIAAQYPVVMSNKRAEDRLLISLLGLEGLVYSDTEFAGDNENNLQSASIFTFGKHKGKSVQEVLEEDRGFLEWFTTKFTPRNPLQQSLVDEAKSLLAYTA